MTGSWTLLLIQRVTRAGAMPTRKTVRQPRWGLKRGMMRAVMAAASA